MVNTTTKTTIGAEEATPKIKQNHRNKNKTTTIATKKQQKQQQQSKTTIATKTMATKTI